MRMIGLVLEYRFGLVRRERTLWKDRVHVAPPLEAPDSGLNEDLIALAKPLAKTGEEASVRRRG